MTESWLVLWKSAFMIYSSLICHTLYLSYMIYVWGCAAKSYISKLHILQKHSLWLIYFAPNDAHAVPLFIETKILQVNVVYFDTVAYLVHDIWKGLAPLPIRALFKRSNEINGYNTRCAVKGNYLWKEVSNVNWKISKAVFENWSYIMESNFSSQSLRKKK